MAQLAVAWVLQNDERRGGDHRRLAARAGRRQRAGVRRDDPGRAARPHRRGAGRRRRARPGPHRRGRAAAAAGLTTAHRPAVPVGRVRGATSRGAGPAWPPHRSGGSRRGPVTRRSAARRRRTRRARPPRPSRRRGAGDGEPGQQRVHDRPDEQRVGERREAERAAEQPPDGHHRDLDADVRTRPTGRPVRRTRPVMSPSRGPGPIRAPTYSAVASPLSAIPATTSTTRRPQRQRGRQPVEHREERVDQRTDDRDVGERADPGRWRSGIQHSSTRR